GPIAHGIHAVAEREDALDVFDFLAEWRDGIELAVVVGVANEEEAAAFLRGENVAVGGEPHSDERAGLFVGDEALDGGFGVDQESRAFVGDDDLVAPRQHTAERAVDLGREPFGIADVGLGPVGKLLDAGAPGLIGGETFERAAFLFDDDAGDEAGGAGV